MPLYIRPLFALALFCLTTGCEINRILTIKPDGSGQIYERFLASRDSYAPEKKSGVQDESATAAPPVGIQPLGIARPTAELIVKQAANFGQGVEVASFKKIETEDMLGYEAVYEFPDVSRVRADSFLQGPSDTSTEKPVPPDPAKCFEFTKGEVSELRVPMKLAGSEAAKNATATEQAKEDPKQREAFLTAMKHINLRTTIHVAGTIEETNSHFRENNDVVVSEMNLKGYTADPKHAQEMKDAEAGKKLSTEPPVDDHYIKNEEVEVLKIRFR